MGVENAVYGLIAGLAIVLMGVAFRPRDGGRRISNDERVAMLGWTLVATFFVIVLQLAGVGAVFAIVTSIAAAILLMYGLGRRLVRRSDR